MTHYDVLAETIEYLISQSPAQPDLRFLAKRAGYEPTQFQKLFTEYAGLSPKQFTRFLTYTHARDILHSGKTTLDASHASTLSSASRLHDLCLQIEAATPGEVKARGKDLEITYGWNPSPLGDVMIAKTKKGICWLGFRKDGSRQTTEAYLKKRWPYATLKQDDQEIHVEAAALKNLLNGVQLDHPLKLNLYGTNFQLQVWRALLAIPVGQTTSYKHIAEKVCSVRASRAVGAACGANPVAVLIPCHRVIQASGIIENYAYGSARKKFLLGREQCTYSGAAGSDHQVSVTARS